MGVKRIDESLCNGCGICVEDCPMDVLRMDEETDKAYIRYPGDCQVCFLCEIGCSQDAIEIDAEVVRKLKFPYQVKC